MNLLKIVCRNLRQHLLSTCISSISMALAGALWLSVWCIKDEANATFTNIDSGFDAVLGARGSKLQLVLNAIFHIESSPGNLDWEDYLDISKRPEVAAAVPIAVGDNYLGYRLVGVASHLFSEIEYKPGKRLTPENGKVFDPNRREAVVGNFAAQQLGLKVGDRFHPYHGLIFDENEKHAETYVVVGVLSPSNTPADRVIWIPLSGLQNMSGHDPKSANEVSAVLLKFRSAHAGFRLSQLYNKLGDRLTLAWPIGQIMSQFFSKMGWLDRVLALVAYLVAVVALGSILTSIYNSMNERRRDIAILRALGARRIMIFSMIVIEATAIATFGMIIAFLFYGLIFSIVASILRSEMGVVLNVFTWHPVMFWAPVLMIVASAFAGLIPAVKAYRTNVAHHLVPIS